MHTFPFSISFCSLVHYISNRTFIEFCHDISHDILFPLKKSNLSFIVDPLGGVVSDLENLDGPPEAHSTWITS